MVRRMSGREVHFQTLAAAQIDTHQVGRRRYPVFGHRLNLAILKRKVAQCLEAGLPELGRIGEMPQSLAVGENPGPGHVPERGTCAARVVDVDVRQDDVVDLIGADAQFGQRGQQIGDARFRAGVHDGLPFAAEEVGPDEPLVAGNRWLKVDQLQGGRDGVYLYLRIPPRANCNPAARSTAESIRAANSQ